MLKFTLRTTVAPAPAGTIGLVGLAGGGLATVDSTGAVTPLAGTGRVTVNTDWSAITSRPTAFPPTAHAHEISDVNGLQSALDTISGGGISDGDKGDVTVTSGGTVWSIDTFAGGAKGLVPPSSGGTVNFLRADGTWAAPSGGGGGVPDGDKGDLTVSSSGTVWTLDTVNLSPQTDTFRKITVNGKGLVTATSAVSASDLNATFGTVSQNTFYGGQDGVNGTPVFRNIVANDISNGILTNAKLANMATATIKGRVSAGSGAPEDLTGTQVTTLLDVFTSSLKGVVPASGGGTANFLRADGTWAAPGGGSDPWTYIKLGSDFPTSSATAVDITGMSFAPSANTQYEFEAVLFLRTATATVGPRPGLAWATGGTDGVAMIDMTSSATARLLVNGNINAALLAAVGGLPNTTQSYPAKVTGSFVAGASPSGNIRLQMASETAGTTVTVKAGSFLKYRTI